MKKTGKGEIKQLSLKTKLIYGTGDFYGGASATIISLLLLFFLTDVVGIRAVYAGTVVFIGRFVDAITDPLMGRISDSTRSRLGRRNPYFLFSAVPVGLAFGLLWVKVPFDSEGLLLGYYSVAYILFSLTFTAVMVPYAALAPELTDAYHERTSLVSTRMAFSIIGALFAAVIPKTIIDTASMAEDGFMTMGVIFGIVFIIIWINMFLHMRDKEIYQASEDRDSFIRALLSTFRNRAFVYLIAIYLFSFIVNDIISANFIYYLTYYLKQPGLYTAVMGGLLVTAVMSLMIYVRLSKSLGKRKTYILGASYWLVALLGLLLLKPETPGTLIILYAVFLGVGLGVAYAMPWSMLPDTIDLDEVISGRRREGLYSGVMTFLRKLSSSIAILTISFILDLSGYIPSEQAGDMVQSLSAINAIRGIITIAPAICLVIAIYCAFRYPIRMENYHFIQTWLGIRRGTDEVISPEEQAEIKKEVEKIIGRRVYPEVL